MSRLRHSAAVLLLRGQDEDREILLVERSPKLRFFGGFWALPGGVLDLEDRCEPPEDQREAPDDRDLRRCALRELFEETGVLLGPLASRWGASERDALRRELLEGGQRESWDAAVRDLPEATDALVRVCRVTTPEFSQLRYRTTFYLANLPEGEAPEILRGELEQGCFWRPKQAIAAWLAGDLRIVPPVLFLVESLAAGDVGSFLRSAEDASLAIEAGRLHSVRNTPGIFMAPLRTPTLPPATTTNCYLVGDRRIFVVDPATYEDSERARLFDTLDAWRSAGRELAGVLVTHHHHDHVGSVAAVAERYGLPVFAHPETLRRLPHPVRDGRELHDGDRIELGTAPDGSEGWHLEVLHTPGHDRGHLVFLESRYRAAIVGDLVSTVSTIVIDPPEGHLATYLASLERALAAQIRMLYPAHGPVHPDGSAILRHYLRHRAAREEKLVAALAAPEHAGAPIPLEQLLPRVYGDVDPALYGLAERSLLAGLQKLAEEGQAREVGEGSWQRVAAPA